MAGWILVHRQIEDNPIWKEKPFSKGQAWVDLLLMANHADNEILLGNNIVTIKRGQFHTSEVILAKRWGWGRKKINLFLTLLEKQKMCTSLRTWRGTTITIENYTVYQDMRTSEGTGSGTLQEQPAHIIGTQTKNVKNLNKKDIGKTPAINKQVLEYCGDNQQLLEAVQAWVEMRQQGKKKDTFTPRAVVLALNKLDELSNNQIEKAKIVDQTVENGWATFYPLKEKTKPKEDVIVW